MSHHSQSNSKNQGLPKNIHTNIKIPFTLKRMQDEIYTLKGHLPSLGLKKP